MGKKKDGVYLGACLSPAARRDLKQPAVRRRQLLPSRKPSKTSTPCAARRAHKKDLSQVNPQLYEWLATVNERSNGTLATPSGEQAPNNTPKASRGTDSTNSISQNREKVNPGSQKSQEGRGVFCCPRSCARALTRGYQGDFQDQTPFRGAFLTPEISAEKVLLENLEKLLKND